MKFTAVVFCLVIGACAALPANQPQNSVLSLLKDLEGVVEKDGKILIEKLINVIHHVESSVVHVKDLVPKVYEDIHRRADEVLAGLKKVTEEVQELLGRKNVYFGYDLLSGLTELTGGAKLSTVLDLLSLADKAHKIINDAKQFVPHLEETLNKVQSRIESHVRDFAEHVVKELGIQEVVSHSVVKKIEDLFERVEKEAHLLILDLVHKMEEAFDVLREELPEEYQKVKSAVEEVRGKIHELVSEIEKSLVMRSFNLLDIAGNVSGGTSLGTVFKVMSLIDKFNTVVQDVKNFGPKAELVMQHSVKRVADSAQQFLSHAADQLLQ